MTLNQLTTYNFRNLKKKTLEFHSSVNIFLGENGQGKTNLLEAIYLCTKATSFRPGKPDNLICRGKTCAYVDSRFSQEDLSYKVKIELGAPKKRTLINDKAIGAGGLSAQFFSVLFSPESLAAIKSGPDERRTLVDEILLSIEPKHTKLIAEYKKALQTRNKVLKNYRSEEVDLTKTMALLESINPIFFKLAADLTHQRAKALFLVKENISKIFSSLIDEKNVEISVEYLISSKNGVDWSPTQVYNALLERAKELASVELSSGISLVGPHKHDIRFLMDGEDSRYFCSQGQQRALIIAIKMAQIILFNERHGKYPLLLLDDVLSELDLNKRTQLIKFLNHIDAQIFITTTDLAFRMDEVKSNSKFAEGNFFVFEIKDGEILKSET